MDSDTPRNRAANLLNHYLEAVMRKAGMRTDRDTTAEIDEIVDAIIEASVRATLRRLENRRY